MTNRTLSAVIEEALRQHLSQQRMLVEREPVTLTTVEAKGLMPGVDLDDSASLLDFMEEDVEN